MPAAAPQHDLADVLRSASRLQQLVPDAVLVGGSAAALHAGHRQMRRTRPLETCEVEVSPCETEVVPTAAEALRVKAYLVVQRTVVRDFLDVVALADHLGHAAAVEVLGDLDAYYDDRSQTTGSVLTELVLALAEPSPRDPAIIDELPRYKGLDPMWHEWSSVVAACQSLALDLSGAR